MKTTEVLHADVAKILPAGGGGGGRFFKVQIRPVEYKQMFNPIPGPSQVHCQQFSIDY